MSSPNIRPPFTMRRLSFPILILILGFPPPASAITTRRPIQRSNSRENPDRMSIANCTCKFYTQPLDHFAVGTAPTFSQRYCVFDEYESDVEDRDSPLFLYVGNESPVDQYANHTGLMWELAPKHDALIVFAEHRYEGESKPVFTSGTAKDCMSYASSAQALADYASLLSYLNPGNFRPVVAFGGSYGGMLSSWMRMKYPGSIAGAIASSAPIWGLPLTAPPIDGAWVAISRALTDRDDDDNDDPNPPKCFDNLLASWSLILEFGKTDYGRSILKRSFDLCHDLKDGDDVDKLLEWAQSPWFDMSEGDYPFPSTYITFAVGPGLFDLPAWPMRVACEAVNAEYGVRIQGNKSNVDYIVSTRDDRLRLDVNWDDMAPLTEYDREELYRVASSGVEELFVGVKEAIAVWFNVTKDKQCFRMESALGDIFDKDSTITVERSLGRKDIFFKEKNNLSAGNDEAWACARKISSQGCWGSLCCNENLNMAIYLARGMGNDFFWPPNHPRNTTLGEIIAEEEDTGCADPRGIFGYPQKYDAWSQWLDDYYGGLRIGMHSNIIFSNGLHDPWSAGGVYPGSVPDTGKYDGPMVMNITEDGSVISLILDKGGHHLDLMFSDENDPKCAKDARKVEDEHIGRWIKNWRKQICVGDVCNIRL